ncbi:hypothetical protein BMW23_0144 [Bodo saltans virus]|uniref:Uncharacterized protein n=1 Tax=Bodo saltans virus TaxID=2024608 RepID=A0A2H4UTD7_9VIRU|nr:hypothetical protein QJ851_gp0140 [Bodo saltans virus]ATZ80203.1 hypothetical protein BMW23_0144 [Bodo saltans virus]
MGWKNINFICFCLILYKFIQFYIITIFLHIFYCILGMMKMVLLI